MNTIYRIYRSVNKINKKVYIGYTNKSLEQRTKEHIKAAKKGSEYVFHKSIRKHGSDNFTWEVLFESKDKNFILNEMESFFIKEHNSFYENGFGSITLNICDGEANLWIQSYKTQKKFMIDESKHKAWHFDDACLHCTTEVKSQRIQLRVFAKLKKPYLEILNKQEILF